ncbi:hypothetical protein Tco_0600140 [Tanacetum coccineum]|uniref:Uncharacterized protein n=1 Tax=Tanacetum coccineum TaxID=301880 RepID=A0ABQ4WAV7_9ASTR
MSNDRIFCRPCMCERCRRNYTDRFCSICCFESGNAFIDDLLNSSNHPPQSQYETYSCELCGNDAHFGYDCSSERARGGGSFYSILKIPIIDDDDDEYTVQYRKYLENSSNAIAPVLPIEDPDNSLSMGDEHLSTIPETESDEATKSSVEDLVPIPNFNDDCTSSDDDYGEDIDYIKASPPDSEIVSLEEIEPDQGELTSVVMEDILGEPRVHVPNEFNPPIPPLMLDSGLHSCPDDSLDCPDFEDSRAHGFVHSYTRASISPLH